MVIEDTWNVANRYKRAQEVWFEHHKRCMECMQKVTSQGGCESGLVLAHIAESYEYLLDDWGDKIVESPGALVAYLTNTLERIGVYPNPAELPKASSQSV